MLQPMTTDRVERFYKDVGTLRLKFPVAEIARATGQSKGNVSKYLSQTLEPSNAFLDRFYRAYADSFKKVGTTKPETPQNGTKSGADNSDTRTEIGRLVARIKAETGLTAEDVATRIGITRQYLSQFCNSGHSDSIYNKLHEAFKDELNHTLTTSTKIPGFEMKPTSGAPTIQDVTIKDLSDLAKSQQELVKEVTGKLITLVSKVIDKL